MITQNTLEQYCHTAVLREEVGKRLFDRLQFMTLQPANVLLWQCGPALMLQALQQQFPMAHLQAVDENVVFIERNQARFSIQDCRFDRLQATTISAGQYQLVIGDQLLMTRAKLTDGLIPVSYQLAPQGLFAATCLGPDSLRELSQALALPSPFIDMHDFGDAMIKAGMVDPVVDRDFITLSYPTHQALYEEAKLQGWLALLSNGGPRITLDQVRQLPIDKDGRIDLSFEIIYGHAWGGDAMRQFQASDGSVRVPMPRPLRGS